MARKKAISVYERVDELHTKLGLNRPIPKGGGAPEVRVGKAIDEGKPLAFVKAIPGYAIGDEVTVPPEQKARYLQMAKHSMVIPASEMTEIVMKEMLTQKLVTPQDLTYIPFEK